MGIIFAVIKAKDNNHWEMTMDNLKLELAEIKSKETKLQMLIDFCDKNELSQCIRLLSMYIAIYKDQFGELSPEYYENILSSQEIDAETAKIFKNGMHEALTILDMVIQKIPEKSYPPEGVTLN